MLVQKDRWGANVRLLNEALLRLMAGVQGLGSEGARERGQTLAEYGLITALVAVAVTVGALILFRAAILDLFDDITDCFL